MAVDHADEHHTFIDRDPSIARKPDLLLRVRPVLPFELAALGIECKDVIVSRGDVRCPEA